MFPTLDVTRDSSSPHQRLFTNGQGRRFDRIKKSPNVLGSAAAGRTTFIITGTRAERSPLQTLPSGTLLRRWSGKQVTSVRVKLTGMVWLQNWIR